MRTMKHWALAASAAAALALAGCGGGGGGSGPSAPSARSDVTLPAGTPDANQPAAGTYQIAAGGTLELNGVVYSCAGSDCTLYVGNDGKVTSRGGMVTAEHSATLTALLKAQADLAAAQAALDAANADLAARQAELATAKANLASTQADLATANTNLMAAQADLATANANLMAAQADLATANANLASTQADLATANATLAERKAALDAAQARVDELIASGTATAEELATAKANLTAAQGNLTDAQGNVTRLEGELATATQNLADKQAELDTATGNVTRLEGELATATQNLADKQAELDTAKSDLEAKETELQTAKDQITALQALLDDARQEPQRVAIQAAINALNSALAKVDASADDDDVKAADAALAAARKAITDATYLPQSERDARTADVNTIAGNLATAKVTRTMSLVAKTKEEAIATEAAQTTDAGLGGTGVTTYSMTIERPRSGTKIEIEDTALAADDDPKFTQMVNLGSGTTMHTRTQKADDDGNVVQETVVVTTDIEAPKPTPFADVAGQTLNQRDLDPNVDADGDGTNNNDYTALGVDGTNAAVRKLVMSNSFSRPTSGSTTVTHDFLPAADDGDPNTPGNQPRKAAEVRGTYNGAMGMYRCHGTNTCQVTVNSKGEITALTGSGTDWIFTPDTGAKSYVADANFLHYGFWLQTTTDKDKMVEYDEVETFAGSSIAATGGVGNVTGTATYEGGATGVYVHSVDNADGTRKRATSGHFTADASLKAYFGQPAAPNNNIPPNMLNTLTGTIDKFVLSGEEANNWSVALQSDGDPNTSGIQPDTDGVMAGTAKGSATGQDGSFTATFHGPNTDSDGNTIAPHTVVGEFNSFFTNGSVAGAFGARETDD